MSDIEIEKYKNMRVFWTHSESEPEAARSGIRNFVEKFDKLGLWVKNEKCFGWKIF